MGPLDPVRNTGNNTREKIEEYAKNKNSIAAESKPLVDVPPFINASDRVDDAASAIENAISRLYKHLNYALRPADPQNTDAITERSEMSDIARVQHNRADRLHGLSYELNQLIDRLEI